MTLTQEQTAQVSAFYLSPKFRAIVSKAKRQFGEDYGGEAYIQLCDLTLLWNPAFGVPFEAFAATRLPLRLVDVIRKERKNSHGSLGDLSYEDKKAYTRPTRITVDDMLEGLSELNIQVARLRAGGMTLDEVVKHTGETLHTIRKCQSEIEDHLREDYEQKHTDYLASPGIHPLGSLPIKERLSRGRESIAAAG